MANNAAASAAVKEEMVKRIDATARWMIPIIVLLLALLLTACERPLQEAPAATEPAATIQPGDQPTVPVPPTPVAPTGGEELPPVSPGDGEGETPVDGGETPADVEGGDEGEGVEDGATEEGATEDGDAAGDNTYTVQAGDTLFSIATSYGLTVDELAAANDITNVNLIDVGQVLIIPSPGAEEADETATDEETGTGDEAVEGEEQIYIVKPGDILGLIAQQFGITAADLAAYNGIELDTIIYPGDELRIPPDRKSVV